MREKECQSLSVVYKHIGNLLSLLAELGALVRVWKETLGLAYEVDDALVDAELVGDFARMVLGCGGQMFRDTFVVMLEFTYQDICHSESHQESASCPESYSSHRVSQLMGPSVCRHWQCCTRRCL